MTAVRVSQSSAPFHLNPLSHSPCLSVAFLPPLYSHLMVFLSIASLNLIILGLNNDTAGPFSILPQTHIHTHTNTADIRGKPVLSNEWSSISIEKCRSGEVSFVYVRVGQGTMLCVIQRQFLCSYSYFPHGSDSPTQ